MKLEEAITFLEDELTREVFYYGPERKDALKLGIEALKWFKQSFDHRSVIAHRLLPGETKE